ncbi:MAG: hypothetical protein H7039_04700 [Bryobacteraceae bacterium]|nr:hypothetical protein [Bryobacteraceae bacterium]
MIAPLTELPIKGVIWYQGESNTSPERAPLYSRLFPALIASWRRAWRQGDFPFLYVQLANYNAKPDSQWPIVREAQLTTLSTANTAMAVTIDAGEPADIHPRNKRIVAERLSLAARAMVYGENVEYSGPAFRSAHLEGDRIRVWFTHASGLRLVRNSGFEILGQTGEFQAADVVVEGSSLLISSPGVIRPKQVRYAWKDNPEATLYNGAGLPASPFRTRD